MCTMQVLQSTLDEVKQRLEEKSDALRRATLEHSASLEVLAADKAALTRKLSAAELDLQAALSRVKQTEERVQLLTQQLDEVRVRSRCCCCRIWECGLFTRCTGECGASLSQNPPI